MSNISEKNVKLLGNQARQLGDYGEHLTAHLLIRLGYDVAMVDHVGADLIATKDQDKVYAVSVKTRKFKQGSNESRMYNFSEKNFEKLTAFSSRFEFTPLLAVVTIDDREGDQHESVYVLDVNALKENGFFNETKAGNAIKFSKKNRDELQKNCKHFMKTEKISFY